ncbi:LysM peptidoglycan-binding domain-containing protein [Paucisalibacillus globulus]|uniref:LysM peptidoglycan-binding domain-containing protein n=1 Tax=Paucisalibacillus globulus TaxID=351095 RepID=UPI00041728D6|nr:LysM peptidoglycan-binding domain-containing protein [Paucisalibacillus globulus]
MQIFYTVQSGDTINQIASRFGTTTMTLINANNIPSHNTIFIGQQLSIPPGINRYRVQSGDTIYKIASQFRIPISAIIQANDLSAPYVIYPNQLLEIPPGLPYYTVQPGDSLYRIGLRYKVTTAGTVNTELIRTVNNLSSTVIYPGMRLFIPFAPFGEKGIIAYTAGDIGSFDIWLYDVSSGNTHQLTNRLGESFSVPYWSPNRDKIAFVGRGNIIYLVQINTGVTATIDQLSEGIGAYLNWSPNNSILTYSKPNQIVLYQVNTNQFQIINQSEATDVQWFPNGNQLLFQAPDENGISQLYRIQANGTNRTKITANTGGRYNHVRLSPNGQFVLYTTPGASISIIHIIDLSTGSEYEVEGGPLGKNYFPTWSHDATSIAFSATSFEELGYFSLIKTTDNHGNNEQTISISNCFSTPVDWSPNGTKIAYLSGCTTEISATELWVTDVNRHVSRRLVTQPNIMALEWAPEASKDTTATYQNSQFRVQFQYPSHWRQVSYVRYEGAAGFFQLAVKSSPATIGVVCQNEAHHILMPYGSDPQITHTSIQNQEACFIYPSLDQPAEMNNQAAFIIRYPNPITIGEDTYQFFILWADSHHINEMVSTVDFI